MNKFFILFLFFSFSSCSLFKSDKNAKADLVFGTKDFAEALVTNINKKWFSNEKYRLQNSNGDQVIHRFFDVEKGLDEDKKRTNVVITTVEDSPYLNEIDLRSGQIYTSKKYCKQKDIWGDYQGNLFRPPFSIGFIPGMIDQLGKPQKVIVFGPQNYYEKNYLSQYFDVKIIGGFIEQVCPARDCLEVNSWKSRIVIVAVDSNLEKFKEVNEISDLAKVVDWNEVKAFIENGQGHNKITDRFYPAFRVGAPLGSMQAIKQLQRFSLDFTKKDQQTLKKSCHKLYDHIWNNLGKEQPIEKMLRNAKTSSQIARILKKRSKVKSPFFNERFYDFFQKYEKQYKSCMELVYPYNYNKSYEAHRFFVYYSAVHKLHALGFTYSCNRNVWAKNSIVDGKRFISKKKEFAGCSPKSLDQAFEFSINILKGLHSKANLSMRYIDYDSFNHKKIYSWVNTSNKRFQCESGEDIISSKYPFFPKDDMSWRKRTINIRSGGFIY